MPPKKGPISKGNFIFQPFLRASCYFSEDVFSKEVTGTTTFSKSLRLRIHDARDREDLIDQHVAYFLRKNPEAIRCKVCHLGSRSLDFLLDALNKQEIQSLKLFFFFKNITATSNIRAIRNNSCFMLHPQNLPTFSRW